MNPFRSLHDRYQDVAAFEGPGDGLYKSPGSSPVVVESKLLRQTIKAMVYVVETGPELAATHERRNSELTLPGEWLRIDGEPWLSFGTEDVTGMEILMYQDLFALGKRKGLQRCDYFMQ